MNNTVLTALLALVIALLTVSCFKSKNTNGDDCSSNTSKLRQCGLLSEGEFGCPEPSNSDEQNMLACVASCTLDADCRQLENFFCFNDFSSTYGECTYECYRQSRFKCKDSGKVLDDDEECDGFEDCVDGSDEENCFFQCQNGDSIPAGRHCNNEIDCEDGSDEEGCPKFVCDDGEEIPEAYRCDDNEDCVDGSDERDCPKKADIFCPQKGD